MEASKLKDILEQHKLWLDTNGVQGERANLGGADLEDADLRRANLRRADLNGADLTGAILYSANLEGANLEGANLSGAYLTDANLTDANLTDANLTRADLTNTILPDISWIIPGCLVQLNHIKYDFLLKKDNKLINFVQDNIGFFIQDNEEEKTFDMLVEDSIIRNIPDWVKYTGLRQIATESV